MAPINQLEIPDRDYGKLAPWFAEKVRTTIEACHAAGYPVAMFEGWRSDERQNWLFASGRTRPGKWLTNAQAGQSWHSWGLACDCAISHGPRDWSWDADWTTIQRIFVDNGFETITKEQNHFQISGGLSYKEAISISQKFGVLGVWDVVHKKILF